MGKLLILHLSDIHIRKIGQKPINENNPILSMRAKIARAIREVGIDVAKIIVLISGDLAYSGLKEEYNEFGDFIDNLITDVKKEIRCEDIEYIMVPGNHDCLLNSDEVEYREGLIKMASDKNFTNHVINEKCIEVQSNYFIFENRYNIKRQDGFLGKIYYRADIEFSGKSIAFHCINTSWLSQRHESQGMLFIPSNLLEDIERKDSDLSISVIHHPINWMNTTNHHFSQSFLSKISQFTLSGHEHSRYTYKHQDAVNSHVYLEAGALQPHNDGNLEESRFNVYVFDPSQENFTIYYYNLEEGIYKTNDKDIFNISMDVSYSRIEVYPKREYLSSLRETYFENAKNSSKILEEVYIPAYLSNFKDKKKVFRINTLIDKLYDYRYLSLFGDELSGKTTSLKYIGLEMIKIGFHPITLAFTDFNGFDEEAIIKTIKRAFLRQYEGCDFAEFQQTNLDSKAIIIDDFHRLNIGKSKAEIFMKTLKHFFGFIIIASKERLYESEFVSAKYGLNIFEDFEKIQLEPLGHQGIYEIVLKWVERDESLDIEHKDQKIDDVKNILDSILLHNPFPAYPIFLLALLDKIDNEGNVIKENDKSHIYESLITLHLSDDFKDDCDLHTRISILSRCAGYILENDLKYITKQDFLRICRQYSEEVGLEIDNMLFLREMIRRRVFDEYSGDIKFQFRYTMYYASARYIEDKMAIEPFPSILSSLVDNFQDDRNANILLFILHTTRNRSIIEMLINKAKECFADIELNSFKIILNRFGDIDHILPELVFKDTDPEKNTRETLKKRDEMRYSNENSRNNYDEDTERRDAKMANNDYMELEKSFKLINILGQVVKSQYGRLERDIKVRIIDECIILSLKLINRMLSGIENFIDSISNSVTKDYENSGDLSESEKQEIVESVKKLLYVVVQSFIVGIVRESAQAISTEKLNLIYDDVKREHPDNTEYDIHYLAIKLFGYKGLPMNDIERLAKKLRPSRREFDILAILVLLKMYFFRIDDRKKREVLGKLNIKYDPLFIRSLEPKDE